MGVFSDGGQTAVAREIHEALDWYEENGWAKKPADFHEAPPPLEDSDMDFEYRDVSGLPMEIMSDPASALESRTRRFVKVWLEPE